MSKLQTGTGVKQQILKAKQKQIKQTNCKTTMSINLADVKKGDRVWTVNHYEVVDIRDGWYHLKPDDGKPNIRARGGVLEGAFHSVSKYTKEEKVSTTVMAKKIKTAGHGEFQVTFNKKIDDGDFIEKVMKAVEDKSIGDNKKKRKRWMKDNHKGDERVMKARLLRDPDTKEAASEEAGRIKVWDVEKKGQRLIDERTITSLISEGVKYVKK